MPEQFPTPPQMASLTLHRVKLYWWTHGWAKAHVYELCARAFMEAPTLFGTRMRGGTALAAAKRGLMLCGECMQRFGISRMNAHMHKYQSGLERDARKAGRTGPFRLLPQELYDAKEEEDESEPGA